MGKIAISFISGIIFSVLVAFVLSNYNSWFLENYRLSRITNFFPQAITDRNLYVESITYGGNKPSMGYIYSIDIKSRNENWRISTEGNFHDKLIVFSDTLYLKKRSELDAINADTGEIIWSKNFGHNSVLGTSVCQNYVIFERLDRISSYRIGKAEMQWEVQTDARGGSIVCNDKELYYTTSEGVLHALDLESGKENWRTTLSNAN